MSLRSARHMLYVNFFEVFFFILFSYKHNIEMRMNKCVWIWLYGERLCWSYNRCDRQEKNVYAVFVDLLFLFPFPWRHFAYFWLLFFYSSSSSFHFVIRSIRILNRRAHTCTVCWTACIRAIANINNYRLFVLPKIKKINNKRRRQRKQQQPIRNWTNGGKKTESYARAPIRTYAWNGTQGHKCAIEQNNNIFKHWCRKKESKIGRRARERRGDSNLMHTKIQYITLVIA